MGPPLFASGVLKRKLEIMPSSRLTHETRGALAPLLLLALKSAEVGVVVKAQDGSYLYASGLPDYFPSIVLPGATDADLFEGDWLDQIVEAQEEVLNTGRQVVLELARNTNTQYWTCECTVQRYESAGMRPAILITFVDLTNERKREDTLRALLREVSHRSKNLLAIVQSIASQTARTSDDLGFFLTKFRGRLAALSSAQDLVTDSNWRGANFRELAKQQFLRYVETGDQRISVVGDDVILSPNGATHIGLALHELITNSVAFGALSNRSGKVQLSCAGDDEGAFTVIWDEDTGTVPDRTFSEDMPVNGKKFGSTVLERVVPSALEGKADYDIAAHHVIYRLNFKSA